MWKRCNIKRGMETHSVPRKVISYQANGLLMRIIIEAIRTSFFILKHNKIKHWFSG